MTSRVIKSFVWTPFDINQFFLVLICFKLFCRNVRPFETHLTISRRRLYINVCGYPVSLLFYNILDLFRSFLCNNSTILWYRSYLNQRNFSNHSEDNNWLLLEMLPPPTLVRLISFHVTMVDWSFLFKVTVDGYHLNDLLDCESLHWMDLGGEWGK